MNKVQISLIKSTKIILILFRTPLCVSYLFRNISNLRLYAKPARLTLRCSIRPRYFTWCLISASSNCPSVKKIKLKHLFAYFLCVCVFSTAQLRCTLLSNAVPECLDSLDFRQRMYQASFAVRISVSFSRLLLNWAATYRHMMRVIIPNSLSVRCTWLRSDTVRVPLAGGKRTRYVITG